MSSRSLKKIFRSYLLLIFAGLRLTRTVAYSLHLAICVCEGPIFARRHAYRRLGSIVVHQQSCSSRISSSLRLSLRLRTLRMRKRRADGAAKTRSFCFWRSHCSSAIGLQSNSLSPRNKRQFWPFIFLLKCCRDWGICKQCELLRNRHRGTRHLPPNDAARVCRKWLRETRRLSLSNRQATDRSFRRNISALLSSSLYQQHCVATGPVFSTQHNFCST